jgi:hypothetical protein
MSMQIDPTLEPQPISKMHPTQITVGRAEVEEKVKELKDLFQKKDAAERLGANQVPGVLGPKGIFYLIDHHHLCLALTLAKQGTVLVRVVADLQHLTDRMFWNCLDARGWCHPYSKKGIRKEFTDIPESIDDLIDDPYRSLAGFVRNAGGYAKNAEPFSEFQWADFLRVALPDLKPGDADMKTDVWKDAIEYGVKAARSHPARYLPGWCGVH